MITHEEYHHHNCQPAPVCMYGHVAVRVDCKSMASGGEGVITWSVQSGHTISRTTIHKQYVYGDDDCDGREWQITQIHKGFNKFYLHELQKTQCYSQIYTYKNMPKYIYKFTHLYLYTNMITYLSSNTTWRICKCTCCIFVYVHKGPL